MPDPISWSLVWPYYLAALAFGYLLGSIPFGLILTRAAGLGDIRNIGSGSVGATNVLRTGNKTLAAATLLLDAAKGVAACMTAARWGPDTALVAGYGAMLGHSFPVWLGFRGGKGVATALGAMLALSWPIAVASLVTWAIVAAVFRYSSLAALVAAAVAPIYAWYLPLLWAPSAVRGGDWQMVEFAAILAVLIWIRHHANIRRLLTGEESKIGRKAS